MSETDLVSTPPGTESAPRKRGGLSGMVLADLRQLAGELNIPDIAGMRKGDLIAAIKERQGGGVSAPAKRTTRRAASADADQLPLDTAESVTETEAPARRTARRPKAAAATEAAEVAESSPAAPAEAPAEPQAAEAAPEKPTRRRRAASRPAGAPDPQPADTPAPAASETNGQVNGHASEAPAAPESADASDSGEGEGRRRQTRRRERGGEQSDTLDAVAASVGPSDRAQEGEGRNRNRNRNNRDGGRNGRVDERNPRTDSPRGDGPRDNRPDTRNDVRTDPRNDLRGDDRDDDLDDDGDGRGRRGRRYRDRRRGRDRNERTTGGGGDRNVDTEVREDDVLLPVAGIVDILDNYAFVRTTGYLSGPNDVYVSLSMVRKHGLRRGDAITGAVRQPREGEQQRQKFNPLVRIDSINGRDPESGKDRPEFTKLTPLYPNERLRLETEPSKLTTRVIDLVMPVGKGQRALIVSPPKAGKTMIMQAIANAITTNNPECHLMVVLVDERPEEVTDMQRSVKGEVIASTFDRPPSDHTAVAELAIERAKRLVELGHDVVVLLDSITRLGRAYNLAAPASGRILSGGVDSTALYPPKRFLGAARNIEDGGSLTIFASALVETGSTMDTVIFEEFKGTGNAELKLDRKLADKRIFPAVDVDASSTRKEELLMSADEFAVSVKLRRVLAALDHQQAIELVLGQLRKTRTNIEFLMQVQKTTPGSLTNDD
ncbi:transcription termination factor Rho [Pseudonocardia xishanensis]|uniref:Transcription termination factor Rho n=1 Tax=Pseudonocardia xishanensis TaxID=630995 RepID=A0ABP8RIK7_9PSEU